jgi:hypothetical protein
VPSVKLVAVLMVSARRNKAHSGLYTSSTLVVLEYKTFKEELKLDLVEEGY